MSVWGFKLYMLRFWMRFIMDFCLLWYFSSYIHWIIVFSFLVCAFVEFRSLSACLRGRSFLWFCNLWTTNWRGFWHQNRCIKYLCNQFMSNWIHTRLNVWWISCLWNVITWKACWTRNKIQLSLLLFTDLNILTPLPLEMVKTWELIHHICFPSFLFLHIHTVIMVMSRKQHHHEIFGSSFSTWVFRLEWTWFIHLLLCWSFWWVTAKEMFHRLAFLSW